MRILLVPLALRASGTFHLYTGGSGRLLSGSLMFDLPGSRARALLSKTALNFAGLRIAGAW